MSYTKVEIPSSTRLITLISPALFVLYVGMNVIVLPGHWPSLSLSLLSAKWIFRNVICCAARSKSFSEIARAPMTSQLVCTRYVKIGAEICYVFYDSKKTGDTRGDLD